MKYLGMVLLLAAAAVAPAQGPDENINERYTVENVEVRGVDQDRLSRSIRDRIQELIGKNFSQEKVNELMRMLHRAFPDDAVHLNVKRGPRPETVVVTFEIRGRRHRLDVPVRKALYHYKQGWSGELDVTGRKGSSAFTVGILSDGDALLERFAGLKARYDNTRLGTSHVRLSFQFDTLHQIWNRATLIDLQNSPEVPGIYRTRQNFEPALTVLPARGLTLTAGTSFQRFQVQYPAAHTEAANAVITTLRYDRHVEESGSAMHRVEAGYSLRAATKALDSDYVYARHAVNFRYGLSRHRNHLDLKFTGGLMNGRAPLFERFVLGNATTLRGWNKFDVAPLGANRMAHGSVEYRYQYWRVFYDVGSLWEREEKASAKHSAGVGLQAGDFFLLVGFPIRSGRAAPLFMMGLNL